MAFKLRSGFLKAGGFKQMGASSPAKKTYAEAKAADPKLDSYIKQRGDVKAGSDEYESLQAKINKAYGKTRDTKSQMKDTAKLQPKKMEAKTIETPKSSDNLKMETREVPKAAELTKKQQRKKNREDTRMERKGRRQENRDNRKANNRKPETVKAKPGSAAATGEAAAAGVAVAVGAKAAKSAGKAVKNLKNKKVDPTTMEVGKRKGDKVSYVKKSAADAPGKKGTKQRGGGSVKVGDYTTPASQTKAGQAAADRKALAEKRAGQTRGQARRDAKKSADYKTNDRQERKNIRDEAAAMSGGSRRDVRKANKASKDTGKMTKTVKAANKPEEFKMSNDPKTPMTKYANPSPKKNMKTGKYDHSFAKKKYKK